VVITGRADAASGPATPVLAQGAGMGANPSAQVRQVQRALQRRGYGVGAPGIDGRSGPLTAAAVRRLQAAHGLAVDGVVGERTRGALGLSRRASRPAQRRSDTRHTATATPARTPAPTQGSAAAPVGSAATPPSTSTLAGHESQRSLDVIVATVVFWTAIACLVALAVAGAWRRVSRGRKARVGGETMFGADTAGRVSASEEDAGGPTLQDLRREPLIGYVTIAPGATSAEHDTSSAAIVAACQGSDWDLLEIVCDRGDGRPLERPGLTHALKRIADGQARGLVVTDLQGFSRSTGDLGALMAWFRDADATLVALDLALDTSTSGGRQVASTLIALGRGEAEPSNHHAINGRTEVRANGRPAVRDRPELSKRIATMRSAGMSLQQIADQLNAANVPTLRGGTQWRPSSIQAALGYRRPGPRDRLPPLENRG
jgi:DNA invertase Pin-like site-specific DNA recombinase/peptidoglycan hydrolase-like protein with peptidoglycan-binding domain